MVSAQPAPAPQIEQVEPPPAAAIPLARASTTSGRSGAVYPDYGSASFSTHTARSNASRLTAGEPLVVATPL